MEFRKESDGYVFDSDHLVGCTLILEHRPGHPTISHPMQPRSCEEEITDIFSSIDVSCFGELVSDEDTSAYVHHDSGRVYRISVEKVG